MTPGAASASAVVFIDVWSSLQTAPPAGSHIPEAQAKPVAQSAPVVHVILHWFVVRSHAKSRGHEIGSPETQSPIPSQLLSVFCEPVHVLAQTVVALG